MWKDLALSAKPPCPVFLSSLRTGEASVSHMRYEEKERLFPITSDFRTVLCNIPGGMKEIPMRFTA